MIKGAGLFGAPFSWLALRALFAVCLLPVVAGVCLMLMAFAASMPRDAIVDNLHTDREVFQYERPPAFNGRKIDVGTECIGVSFGLAPRAEGEGTLSYAVRAPVSMSCPQLLSAIGAGDTLEANRVSETVFSDYARYWHGYAAISAPLLSVMPYRDLRMLTFNAMLALFAALAFRLYRDFSLRVATAFLLPFLFINYAGFFILWTKAVTWFVALGGALILANMMRTGLKNLPVWLFFALGICTAFFDWLTAPLMTVMLPLLIYWLYGLREGEIDWRTQILTSGALIAFWLIGYVGLWSAKFVIAAMFLGPEVWADVIQSMGFRLRGDFESVKLWPGAATLENLEAFKLVWGLLIVGVFIAPFARSKNRVHFAASLKSSPAVWLIALSPFVWWEVMSNHSQIHAIFTHSLLAVTLIPLSLTLYGGGVRGVNHAAR